MNGELLILFIILLLGLILCSFLGDKDCIEKNLNFVEGMENNSDKTFYGENGAYAQLQTNLNENSLVVTNIDGSTDIYSLSDSSATKYLGQNGKTAELKKNSTGGTDVLITDDNGNMLLTLNSSQNTRNTSVNYDNYNHYNGTSYPTLFYGDNGGTARVTKTPNNDTIVITNKNGTTEIYYIDNTIGDPNVSTYYGPNGGSAKMVKNRNGNQAVEITTPNGSKVVYNSENAYAYDSQDISINQYDADNNTTGSDYNTAYGFSTSGINGKYIGNAYDSSLPQGISRSQIPVGDEDLYILKSQVVPPVCPKCPDPIVKSSDSTDVTKCPPCPPCARCPEPAFSCQKVPNYKGFNQDFMPMPVMNDFSTFGM